MPTVKQSKTLKVCILPDIHAPVHDQQAMSSVLAYMRSETWDEVVQLGDFVDVHAISEHNTGKPGAIPHPLSYEYEVANSLLDKIVSAARSKNKACKITFLKGNHEFRADRFVEKHPELKGLVEPHIALRYNARKIDYVESYPRGDVYSIGHLHMHHGYYCNEFHTKKHAEAYGVNIVTGHVHDFQTYSKVTWGSGKTRLATSLGCLCVLDAPYLHGRPSKWVHGFGVAYVKPDGNFNLYPVQIIDGHFVAPNGVNF